MSAATRGKRGTRRPARAKPVPAPPAPEPTPAVTPDGRAAILIGDALTRDDHWGPMLIPLPCGHCGDPPPVPDSILDRTRIIGHVNWLAGQAGWKYDVDLTLTCPACQQSDAWKARQGPVACLSTGASAELAVGVMLASNDYADISAMFDGVEKRYRQGFDGQYRALHPERFRPGRHRAPDPFQRRGAA